MTTSQPSSVWSMWKARPRCMNSVGVAVSEKGLGHLFEHGEAEDLAGEERDFKNGDGGEDFVDGLKVLSLEATPGIQERIGDVGGDDAIYYDGVGGVVVEDYIGEIALRFLYDHFFQVEDEAHGRQIAI